MFATNVLQSVNSVYDSVINSESGGLVQFLSESLSGGGTDEGLPQRDAQNGRVKLPRPPIIIIRSEVMARTKVVIVFDNFSRSGVCIRDRHRG